MTYKEWKEEIEKAEARLNELERGATRTWNVRGAELTLHGRDLHDNGRLQVSLEYTHKQGAGFFTYGQRYVSYPAPNWGHFLREYADAMRKTQGIKGVTLRNEDLGPNIGDIARHIGPEGLEAAADILDQIHAWVRGERPDLPEEVSCVK